MHKEKFNNHIYGSLFLCWIFSCVNDNTKIDLENTQIKCCILCYQKLIIGINSKSQVRTWLISYYKTIGITFLKNYVDAKHIVIVKLFKKEVNFLLKGN
jgi:hypothetical protein